MVADRYRGGICFMKIYLHADARSELLLRDQHGHLQDGEVFKEMKQSRSVFKNGLEYCRNNELRVKKR